MKFKRTPLARRYRCIRRPKINQLLDRHLDLLVAVSLAGVPT